jgi:hypothetical protein
MSLYVFRGSGNVRRRISLSGSRILPRGPVENRHKVVGRDFPLVRLSVVNSTDLLQDLSLLSQRIVSPPSVGSDRVHFV